jgi:plastocyanin
MRKATRVAFVAAAVTALAPASAMAATKTVTMGPGPKAQKTLGDKYFSDPLQYFPSTISIRVGDSVKFVPYGFHTVDIPAKGSSPQTPIAATGKKAAGVNDAAGNPFWFNGQEILGFSPALLKSAFAKGLSYTYNGKKRIQTGLPFQNKPKPVTVRFTKRGTVSYYCTIHPGMKGTVNVKSRRTRVASAKADARRAASQTAAAIKTAKALTEAAAPSDGSIEVGQEANRVHRFAFNPATMNVAVGSTVTFKMPGTSGEIHTATAGPGNPEKEPKSYLGTLAKAFESPTFAPAAFYGSEAPGTVGTLNPSSHGNGFWNSGVLDSLNATPSPASSAVKFDAAGTYTFYCLVHPFMKATVTVA